MRQKYKYDVFIFDCDGVILDSNKLKIEAMKNGLQNIPGILECQIKECLNYFRNNFGKSRYHHIDHFFKTTLSNFDSDSREKLLENFSTQCKELYLDSSFTDGFQQLFSEMPPNCYVASGSDQNELNDVFEQKKIAHHFHEILGSPTPKKNNVQHILSQHPNANALMIGDSKSDFHAAIENGIDFAGYIPYSNTPDILIKLSKEHHFVTFDCWDHFLNNIA